MNDNLCECCSYNEADPEVEVPELVQDRYLAICADCACKFHLRQSRLDLE